MFLCDTYLNTMYNYNHLFYFYMTVKSDGVTAAAKHLRISQPSLSGQLKVLEDNLQLALFRKVGRKNELTKEGAIIFGFCRKMFELSEEMQESITEKIPYASRRISIGVTTEIANSFFVEVISHFLSKYDEKIRPKVSMVSGTHQKLSDLLRFREIDVVVSSFSITEPEIENLQQLEVPVNLVSCMNNIKTSPKNNEDILKILVDLRQDKNASWVMPNPGSKLRSEISRFFELNDLKGKVVFESDVMESLTRSIVDKIGIAFLPLIYVPKELENKVIKAYGPKDGFWKYRIWLSCHSKCKDDHLVTSLSTSLLEVCTPLLMQRRIGNRK